MRIEKNILWLVFLLLFSFSCHKGEFENENAILSIYPEWQNKQIIIIIPGDGCGVCIAEASNYIKEFKGDKRFGFVFSAVYSYKETKLKYRYLNLNDTQFRVDTANNCVKKQILQISPVVLFIKNGRVVKAENIEYPNFITVESKILNFLE